MKKDIDLSDVIPARWEPPKKPTKKTKGKPAPTGGGWDVVAHKPLS